RGRGRPRGGRAAGGRRPAPAAGHRRRPDGVRRDRGRHGRDRRLPSRDRLAGPDPLRPPERPLRPLGPGPAGGDRPAGRHHLLPGRNMTAIACPALDGRAPLGLLAALGTLRLLVDHADPAATLHWSSTDASAILATTVAEDSAALAAWLVGVLDGIGQRQVIPGAPDDLPPPGEAPDRIRLAPAELRRYVSGLGGDQRTNHR